MKNSLCTSVRWSLLAWAPLAIAVISIIGSSPLLAELRVGAAKVDVSPKQLPVLVNGGMTSRSADQIRTRVHARAIVLDDGRERIGIVVVDSCMMPRVLLDEAKQLAATRTQLKPDRILISATHTHTAPSSMGALGTDADMTYVPLLRQQLVEALVAAEANLAPAQVGWGSGMAPQFTALRRWVRRPDRIANDPFGNPTVRANMHSARNPDDAIGPTGPEDPALTMIAFQTLQGEPIAALANFSMHYFGDQPISADYFGLFCDGLEQHMLGDQAPTGDAQPVAIMSHGCSGDIWKKDYMHPVAAADGTIDEFTQGLLAIATQVHADVQYAGASDLAMAETRLPMDYRVPSVERLEWAREVVDAMGDRLPQTQPEIYAREQLYLHEMQSTEVVVQALRIGDTAIVTTPCETYALSGLKLKLQSPVEHTMVIELANGGDGYIPPPEQHLLGGYNTWPARSAGLEVSAEPRIVAAGLQLLEQVCKRPRRQFQQSQGMAAKAILDLAPRAYWRLDEMSASPPVDASGQGALADYEPGVLFFLEGPLPGRFTTSEDEPNRCTHFAGGRLRAELPQLNDDFTVLLSFWNGMPAQAREVTGWMFSRDREFSTTPGGIHLGLCGAEHPGRLMLQCGTNPPLIGSSDFPRWQWESVALVKSNQRIRVYRSTKREPEIDIAIPERSSSFDAGQAIPTWFFGGRSDQQANWEGKLDEIAIFERALTESEISQLFAAF